MPEGVDYISHKIKGKDIFLSAMKTWRIPPNETDDDKVARIELEDVFKTRFVMDQKCDPISDQIQDSIYPGSGVIFPKAFKGINKINGLSLRFWNFFDTCYEVYFNESLEKNLSCLFVEKNDRKARTLRFYLLRTTPGRPLQLHETWQKFRNGINTKAKDLW